MKLSTRLLSRKCQWACTHAPHASRPASPTFLHGRPVRGCPSAMWNRSSRSRWRALPWRKTLTHAPLVLTPATIEVWLRASERTRVPGPGGLSERVVLRVGVLERLQDA